jgi:hypothetical protein
MRNLLSSGTVVCIEVHPEKYLKLMFGLFQSRCPYFKVKIYEMSQRLCELCSFEDVFHIQFLNLSLLCHITFLLSLKITMLLGVFS